MPSTFFIAKISNYMIIFKLKITKILFSYCLKYDILAHIHRCKLHIIPDSIKIPVHIPECFIQSPAQIQNQDLSIDPDLMATPQCIA